MRFVLSCIFFGSVGLLSGPMAISQPVQRISGDFRNLPFSQFVNKLETSSSFHFYYDPAQLDSLTVNIKADQILLDELLNQVLSNSAFTFAIDSISNVFVYNKRYIIQTKIPEDFFTYKKITANTNEPDTTNFDTGIRGNKIFKAPPENKLFEIGVRTNTIKPGSSILAGYVHDGKSGEAIIGAAVYLDKSSVGVLTDQFGYYTLTLPHGRHVIRVSSVGMKETTREIMLYSDGKLNIDIFDDVPTLKNVTVISEKNSNIRKLQMGVEKLDIKTIKAVPVLLGEADILRVVLTLPGVTSVGEASSGFNVRGGSVDQNLVLYNDATIYNPTHFFGFFTAFNSDIVKNVDLYKSSIPEKYGGRLSSVLDVTTKTGNTKKWSGLAGIGFLTSKVTIEGPLVKDKTPVIIGARSTYSNWLLKKIRSEEFRNSKASFYDVDFHLSHTFNSKNNLFLTGYMSNDQFKLNNDTSYKYNNRNMVLKWKHIFNNKMYAIFTGGLDHYDYEVSGEKKTIRGFELAFKIDQANFRADFNYAPNNRHNFDFGLTSIKYKLHPGSFLPAGTQSLAESNIVSAEQALESALYAGDRFTINSRLSLNAGLRYSVFNYLGPHDVYTYIDGLPKDISTIRDTLRYGSGKMIKTYQGPEIRMALRYSLSDNSSVKLSYNTLRQYIHLLSNTTAISPTDIWKLCDPNIRPQQGEQVSVGVYKDFKSNTIETSIEVYYKRLRNYLDYKSGAALVLNQHIETDVISTRGYAYGAELLIKKTSGKLNGWVSYTYSRVLLKMDDSTAGQLINGGKYYPANFDKPHNANLIGNYRFSHRYSISLNTVYSTGRPITLPIAIFYLAGSQRVYYSDRNQYRVPDYFRMDFSVNIEGNHKIKKLTHNFWSVGVYNVTARKNAYSVYFIEENGRIKGYKLSVIGTAIPYITFNLRF
jgi:hypothetical protein